MSYWAIYAGEFGIWMAPALLLFCCLLARRYPGERLLERGRIAMARRRPLGAARPQAPRLADFPKPWGCLLADNLGGRAPPAGSGAP